MTEEELQRIQSAVDGEKEEEPAKPKTMWGRSNLVWSQIQLGRYNPKEEALEVEASHTLTLAEVQSFSIVSF
jgi:hypothetical protein